MFNKTALLALTAALIASEEDRTTKTQANIDAQLAASKAQADADAAIAANKQANAALKTYVESLDEDGNEPAATNPPADSATGDTAAVDSTQTAPADASVSTGTTAATAQVGATGGDTPLADTAVATGAGPTAA